MEPRKKLIKNIISEGLNLVKKTEERLDLGDEVRLTGTKDTDLNYLIDSVGTVRDIVEDEHEGRKIIKYNVEWIIDDTSESYYISRGMGDEFEKVGTYYNINEGLNLRKKAEIVPPWDEPKQITRFLERLLPGFDISDNAKDVERGIAPDDVVEYDIYPPDFANGDEDIRFLIKLTSQENNYFTVSEDWEGTYVDLHFNIKGMYRAKEFIYERFNEYYQGSRKLVDDAVLYYVKDASDEAQDINEGLNLVKRNPIPYENPDIIYIMKEICRTMINTSATHNMSDFEVLSNIHDGNHQYVHARVVDIVSELDLFMMWEPARMGQYIEMELQKFDSENDEYSDPYWSRTFQLPSNKTSGFQYFISQVTNSLLNYLDEASTHLENLQPEEGNLDEGLNLQKRDWGYDDIKELFADIAKEYSSDIEYYVDPISRDHVMYVMHNIENGIDCFLVWDATGSNNVPIEISASHYNYDTEERQVLWNQNIPAAKTKANLNKLSNEIKSAIESNIIGNLRMLDMLEEGLNLNKKRETEIGEAVVATVNIINSNNVFIPKGTIGNIIATLGEKTRYVEFKISTYPDPTTIAMVELYQIRSIKNIVEGRKLNEGLNLPKKHRRTKVKGDYPNGSWIRQYFNDNTRLMRWEDHAGDWGDYTRDENDRLLYYKDSSGYWEKYRYDEDGQLIWKEISDKGIITDPQALESEDEFIYDSDVHAFDDDMLDLDEGLNLQKRNMEQEVRALFKSVSDFYEVPLDLKVHGEENKTLDLKFDYLLNPGEYLAITLYYFLTKPEHKYKIYGNISYKSNRQEVELLNVDITDNTLDAIRQAIDTAVEDIR